MNKKVLSIILGIVVLFIWYKVIASFFGAAIEEEPFQPQQSYSTIDLSKLIANDSIPTPALNYRDPFLGKIDIQRHSPERKVTSSSPKESVNRPVQESKKLNWPTISYHGFVKVHGNKSSMVILKINNQLVQISEGDSYESTLHIRKAYRDSILLEMNGDKRVFHK